MKIFNLTVPEDVVISAITPEESIIRFFKPEKFFSGHKLLTPYFDYKKVPNNHVLYYKFGDRAETSDLILMEFTREELINVLNNYHIVVQFYDKKNKKLFLLLLDNEYIEI